MVRLASKYPPQGALQILFRLHPPATSTPRGAAKKRGFFCPRAPLAPPRCWRPLSRLPPRRAPLTRPPPRRADAKEDKEGWDHRQVRCPVRLVAPQAGEEDRGLPALALHVPLLREGLREADGGGDLEVQGVQKGARGRRVLDEHCAGRAGALDDPPLARGHRLVVVLQLLLR